MPKRQRRHSKQGSGRGGGGQETEMADAENTSGKAPAVSSKKKDLGPHQMAGAAMPGISGAAMMGAGNMMVSGPSSGTQEWEWLTMSL